MTHSFNLFLYILITRHSDILIFWIHCNSLCSVQTQCCQKTTFFTLICLLCLAVCIKIMAYITITITGYGNNGICNNHRYWLVQKCQSLSCNKLRFKMGQQMYTDYTVLISDFNSKQSLF